MDHTALPKRRRRPALACKQCRKRKMKCDRSHPCDNCKKSNISDCTFPATHAPVGTGPGSEGARAGRSSSVRKMVALAPRPATSTPEQPPAQRAPIINSRPSDMLLNEPREVELLAKISELEAKIDGMQRQTPTGAPQPVRDGGRLPEGPRFSNQSSWINQTSLVSQLINRSPPDSHHSNPTQFSVVLRSLSKAQAQKGELYESVAAYKVLSQRINQRLQVSATATSIGARLPPRDDCDRLFGLYTLHLETPFRVLHLPSFWAEYERYWQDSSCAPDLFLLQLKVCMALGSAVHEKSLLWRAMALAWLQEAKAWLARPSTTKRKQIAFEELQLSCLVCLAEATFSTAPEQLSWADSGDLLRKAMGLNLHRDPEHMPMFQAEMRRRLWATILELNLLLSVQANRPPLISASDYDTRAPSRLADEEIQNPGENTSFDNKRREASAGIKTQVSLFDSFPIRLQMISAVNAATNDIPYDERLRFHAELSRARWRLEDSERPLLSIIFSRYVLAIHLPLLGKSIKDPKCYFSRTVSMHEADYAVQLCGLDAVIHHGNDLEDPDPFHRLFLNSAGIFRHLAMQPIFAIFLEQITFLELKWQQPDTFVVQDDAGELAPLAVWERDALANLIEAAQTWTERRIEHGSPDVHTCCFVAACRAYVELLQAGFTDRIREEYLVDKALVSSEKCRSILTNLEQSLDEPPPMEPDDSTETLIDTNMNGETLPDLLDLSEDWFTELTMGGMGDDFAMDWVSNAAFREYPISL